MYHFNNNQYGVGTKCQLSKRQLLKRRLSKRP